MPLSAQLAKILTKGAQEIMSPVMKHAPTMRVLTPEQEAASFATYGKETFRTPEPTVMDELVSPPKEVKLKKGKTREEVELQGGPLSSKLNEQEIGRLLDEHSIEWEYNDNGGITAIEEFSKGPSRKKYFKRNTSLRTIRDWLGYAKGGVIDMRNGGRVSMVHGGSAGVETEEEREARLQAREARQEVAEQLSETEKAVAVTREGTTEPIKYMYDYGKRREGRLSQGPKGRELQKDNLGYFQPEGKKIYVTPRVDVESLRGESKPGREHRWNVPEGSPSLPFVGETKYPERKSTIATEQHEFTHAFLDFLDYAARDKKILSTLSKQDQIKLFKFMDFRQKEEFGPDFEFKGYRIEHELMDQPTDIRTSSFKPGKGASVGDFLSERKGLGTKPESSFTEDLFSPRQDAPPVEYGMGIGKASTISELAKVFNKASAKNPEIHKRALKKWTKSERFFKRPTAEFDKAIKQLQGTGEEEEQLQQEQEQYGQKNGGRVGAAVVAASLMASGGQAMDMRNGGVVGMVHGGPVIDYATPEEKEFDPEVSKQMDALLAKRYAEEKQAAVDYGGFEQPDPMPDAIPPVPKMNPLRIKQRVMASTLKEIADAEGTGEQGYNIVFGTPRGESSSIFINPTTEITSMTLKELDTFQRKLINATRDKVKGVKPGYGTSAVGKYQVTRGTLKLARIKLGYSEEDWNKLKYSPKLQEQIGRVLLEHRGLDKMLEGEITPEQYRIILHNEWASIPGEPKEAVSGQPQQPTPANVERIESGFRNAINELKVGSNPAVN